MKNINLSLLCALCVLCGFTACETVSAPDLTDNQQQLVQTAFDLGVKLGVYKSAQQNPELIPLAEAIADALEGASATDGLLALIDETLIPKYVADPADQIVAREIVNTFAELFRTEIDANLRSAYLPTLANNIRAGVRYAKANPDA